MGVGNGESVSGSSVGAGVMTGAVAGCKVEDAAGEGTVVATSDGGITEAGVAESVA